MADESARISVAPAAAFGDDPALMADLRRTFLQSAQAHVQAMVRSTTVPEWHMAAWRFKGLCATFGIAQLTDLAERAAVGMKGDSGLLRKIELALTHLSDGN
ncbi:MAG TPA: Hpt domain-containing protein [Sphingobium sp.]